METNILGNQSNQSDHEKYLIPKIKTNHNKKVLNKTTHSISFLLSPHIQNYSHDLEQEETGFELSLKV
eukprot:snap_masked-scaffold_50-processed-gene-1.36-mRNA-1 protein AED:1.00 eAED:1.00 QI:0/0/0/0/1/1/4/0/67